MGIIGVAYKVSKYGYKAYKSVKKLNKGIKMYKKINNAYNYVVNNEPIEVDSYNSVNYNLNNINTHNIHNEESNQKESQTIITNGSPIYKVPNTKRSLLSDALNLSNLEKIWDVASWII